MIRQPAVAGQFYPGGKSALLKELEELVMLKKEKEDAIGMVSPHAGYVYSGRVAGELFGSVEKKKTYVLLGPNHTGMGESFGLSSAKSWRTPLGEVEINSSLGAEILKNCPHIQHDDLSHAQEHSIEVELPFLQYTCKGFSIVPITIAQADLKTYREIAASISRSIKNLGIKDEAAIIASSDMTHYESSASAKKKDSLAIDAMLRLDEGLLYDRISSMNISMCGYAPAVITIAASKDLGAKKARLLKYANSGDVSGDNSSVVGYAALTFS